MSTNNQSPTIEVEYETAWTIFPSDEWLISQREFILDGSMHPNSDKLPEELTKLAVTNIEQQRARPLKLWEYEWRYLKDFISKRLPELPPPTHRRLGDPEPRGHALREYIGHWSNVVDGTSKNFNVDITDSSRPEHSFQTVESLRMFLDAHGVELDGPDEMGFVDDLQEQDVGIRLLDAFVKYGIISTSTDGGDNSALSYTAPTATEVNLIPNYIECAWSVDMWRGGRVSDEV